MKRITQLDGLRAVAVLAVVARHRGWFASGGLGVDIFFVLSGFLITGILLNSRDQPHAFANFYKRRVQRIFPSYFLCLFLVGVFAWAQWGRLLPWYVLFAGNFEVVLHPLSRVGPLGAYWSLAVEEHFYFLWPFLVFRLPRRALIATLLAILALSPVIRAIALYRITDVMVIYYLTWFRLDSLAAGSLLAVLSRDPLWRARMRLCSAPAMLALLALAAIGAVRPAELGRTWFLVGGLSLTAVGSAGLVFMLVEDQWRWLTWLLQTRVLRAVGMISFTLYLIQEPIAQGLRFLALKWNYNHGLREQLASIACAIIYAALSWRFIEKPILRLKWTRSEEALEPQLSR